MKDLFLFYFSFDYRQYRYHEKWSTNKPNCSDPKKLFESITFKFEDVIAKTYFYYRNMSEFDGNYSKHWNPIVTRGFGICFTLWVPFCG